MLTIVFQFLITCQPRGGRSMIDDAKGLLIRKGMSAEHIRYENFF
ncbi:MAG: hypothetical protein ACQ9IQ_00520 [Nitrospirales bacterium]|jgi:hypothetical protein